MLPDMEKMKPPMSPEDENVRLLQGENPDPHPMDNHPEHMAKHEDLIRRMQATELVPGISVETQNPQAVGRIQAHIAKHQQAMKQGAMSLLAGMLGVAQQPGNGQQLGGGQMMPQQQGANPFEQAQGQTASMLNRGPLNIA